MILNMEIKKYVTFAEEIGKYWDWRKCIKLVKKLLFVRK